MAPDENLMVSMAAYSKPESQSKSQPESIGESVGGPEFGVRLVLSCDCSNCYQQGMPAIMA